MRYQLENFDAASRRVRFWIAQKLFAVAFWLIDHNSFYIRSKE